MRLGVSWYPEHVDSSRWDTDAARMRATGLELVRIAEFAWACFEPARGQFEWAWLDEAIETLGRHGLSVVMSTPTATPPVWLCHQRPDILGVRPDGSSWPIGTRRHTSFSSSAYREESQRITHALVDRYGKHPAVVAWQLDNEPGNRDTARCWSPEAESRFQTWLEAQFGTIDALNDAWGTAFWSTAYPSFDAVRLPRPGPERQSPSIELSHRRFAQIEMASFIDEQAQIVRTGAPGRDVMTNHHLSGLDADARLQGGLTELISHNCYPQFLAEPLEVSYVHELCRSAAGPSRRAWVMEHQPGPVNWLALNPAVAPGQIRLWMWQAALHGIEAFVFFTWRMARTGQEQYHSALRTHDDEESRGGAEARATAPELRTHVALFARPRARVALLHGYDDAYAIEVDPHRQGFRVRDLQLAAFAAARRLGHEVDVVDESDDWSAYEVVLGVGLHLPDAAREERLRAAVGRGQIVVVGPRSLVRDRHHASTCQPLPTGLVDLAGARIDEAFSQINEGAQTVTTYGGVPAGVWTESLRVTSPGVEVLAAYGGPGHLAGAPAAVRRGGLVLVGFTSQDAWTGLLQGLLGGTDHGRDVEVFERDGQRIVLDFAGLDVQIGAL